jgi:hypothetical protein
MNFFRFIGRIGQQTHSSKIQLTSIDTGSDHTTGNQIDDGTTPAVLDCAAIEKGGWVELVGVNIMETYASGSSIKLAHRVHIFDKTYTAPGKGNPIYVPAPAALDVHKLGYIDIASADYTDYDDDGSFPKYSFVHKTGLSIFMRAADATRALHTLCEAREGSKKFLTNAKLDYEFIFKQH